MAIIRTKKGKARFDEHLDFDFVRVDSDGSISIRLSLDSTSYKIIELNEKEVAELRKKLTPSV